MNQVQEKYDKFISDLNHVQERVIVVNNQENVQPDVQV
jgi:hypothetical protein